MARSQIPDLEAMTDAVKDALTVRRVFGDPIESGDALVIPVVKISGGSGGGFGDMEMEEDGGSAMNPGSGGGGGGGFGIRAKPAGVFRVRDGEAQWQPALDVNRLALGGQIMITVAVVAWAASRTFR